MHRVARVVSVVVIAASVVVGGGILPTSAAPPSTPPEKAAAHRPDNLPGPLTARQDARRKAAHELIRSGQAAPNEDGVVQLAEDKYFQAAVTGEGRVFTVLTDFGDQGSGKLGTTPGPVHNQIEQPDRTVDNSTYWVPDFNKAHFEDMFFGAGESFADFYTKQSSGNYTVAGSVSDWVTVPGNESVYGDNSLSDAAAYWPYIEDTAQAWYDAQIASGRSLADIKAELATFDVWDRYDQDADGNFDEPDGYLDHFQAVHAGEGEEAGGGAQGADAIWSHRWYVNSTGFGVTGPTVGGTQVKFGGTPIGDTGFWIGDYTTEPENGGLGVFAHEYGHDLGLPDLYDTSGGGENGTGFWTLMSGGSWMNHGGNDIGTTPDHMGPWEKLQLGWLDFQVVSEGQSGAYTLSPAAVQTRRQEQAVIVDVPDQPLSTDYVTPAGGHAWWTTSADDLNTTLTRTLDLTGVRSATVSASSWYEIEAGYDYLHAEYSTDGGANWTQTGDALTGSSSGRWTTLKWTVPGGASTLFRFRFQSDGGVHLANAFLDDITVKSGGTTLFTDSVEAGTNGWTAAGGFKISTGTEQSVGDRYYLLENRTYVGYDATLETGPYIFSRQFTAPNWVDRFKYSDGLLVWAVDETYTDNNTSEHVGHALVMPVDARPAPAQWSDGTKPAPRRQVQDAAFGLQATDAATFKKEVLSGTGKNQTVQTLSVTVGPSPAIPTFNDSDPDAYWSSALPFSSILVAGHGVVATVTSQVTGGALTVSVTNP